MGHGPAKRVWNSGRGLAMTKNPPFKWVMGQLKEFRRVVGASYEGYEAEIIVLLQNIEARQHQQGAGAMTQKQGGHSASRGQRELRGLISSVNYNSRPTDSQRNSRERVLMISQ